MGAIDPANEGPVVDVAILTALPVEEEAVERVLGNCYRFLWEDRRLRIGEVGGYRVLVFPLGSMGNVGSAQAAQQVIGVWDPACLMLVGIAGGARSELDDLRLGDVLVPDQVVGYELGKVTWAGVDRRYDSYRPDYKLLAAARGIRPDEWAQQITSPRPDGESDRIPRAHFGPVLSGEKVIADAAALKDLRSAWPRAIGVEMESVGVALTAYREGPRFLMVKAVSDFADSTKGDDWHEYAAEAAARFALAILPHVTLGRSRPPDSGQLAVVEGRAQDATEYLAGETLRYWRAQAKDRRITTPSPAAVRWRWASGEVAVPAGELWSGSTDSGGSQRSVLTAGVVTRLREQLYERLDGARARVVVLGGPGAGKTAAMLLLLIDILERWRAGSAQPVPVWLTLGGWNPDAAPLQKWVAATLARDYPGLAARENGGGQHIAAELVRTGRIALFLDGLDEMPPAVQGRALQVIDRDAAGLGLRVVLTSRPEQYRTAVEEGQLYGAAVIDILPVDPDQAEAFLLAEQLGPRRRAWQQVTDELRACPDSIAARTLTSPLALALARETYARADPADLLDTRAHPTPEALLQHLLARSLALAYPDPAEHQRATRWLSWIAQHMGTSRDLRWWDIPKWTSRGQIHLVVGVAFGLAFGLGLGFGFGFANGAITGGLLGLVVLSGVTFADEPRVLALRRPTRQQLPGLLMAVLAVVLAAGLGFGLVLGLTFGVKYANTLRDDVRPWLERAYLLVIVLVMVLMGRLVVVFVGRFVKLWTTPLPTARVTGPAVAYRSDRRRTVVFGLMFGLTSGLVFGLARGPTSGCAFGLMFGLAGWLASGLGVAMQLVAAEVIWAIRGRRVRFMRLLKTALDRQVLRQAGAIYQFRHADLQDHLASWHPDSK